jgi:hypothetical protein
LPEEQQLLAKPVLSELWMGPFAPKVGPEPVEKTWHHDRDSMRRRATFGVLYPVWEVIIQKSADRQTKLPVRFEDTKRRSIEGIRLYLQASNLMFSDADFHACKFHRPNDQGQSQIVGSTFKDCTFEQCFLGGTAFRHVKFDACSFLRCDFGGSELEECQFLSCAFTDCTAENATFRATEIDPTAFLDGMPIPRYNYHDPIPDGETPAAQLAEEWVEVRRKVASQLLRSNNDIQHTANSDLALFELKRAEVSARFEEIRVRRRKESVVRLAGRTIQLALAWLVLHVTKGGTSLSRLFLGGSVLIPLYGLLLSISHVTFLNQDCYLRSVKPSLVAQQLARAASLFFAIGYTAFSGGPTATVFMTLGALLGLFWYALIAAVVIHRVYR